MKNILVTLILLIATSPAYANINCGTVPVRGLTIQADRGNGHPLANTLSIVVAGIGVCTGVERVFIENNHPAYNSILSTLLSVQARNGSVKVVVSSAETYSSQAKRIEYLELP